MKDNKFIKSRLSFLMFLQFFISGITCPIMSLYLIKCLHFSGDQTGIILSVSGITTILSSVMGTLLADKILTVNRLLGICHLFAAVFMTILTFQTRYEWVLVSYLLYTLSFGCTNGCVSAVVFHHEGNARKNFGGIQMWGSIGWISAGWLFSFVWMRNLSGIMAINRMADALKISVAISVILFIYTFSLPVKKIKRESRKSLVPSEALAVFKKPQNLFLAIMVFITFTSFQYYLFGIGPYLQQSNYGESNIMPLMSVAQIAEAVALGILGYFIVRKDFKKVLIIGLVSNLWRFVALFISPAFPAVISALVCHGVASAFFFTASCIYLDSQCEDSTARPGVQQIIIMLAYGVGASLGNLSAGRAVTMFETSVSGVVNYSAFWGVPLVVNVVMFLPFILLFKRRLGEKVSKQKEVTGLSKKLSIKEI